MNNVLISWILLIVPWLSLFLMKKEDIKRFMPAALFTGVTSVLIYQSGLIARFWFFKEIHFPVIMCGLLPVAALWVLRFTYERFWIYTITNAILDLGFAFLIIPWFARRGIFGVGHWTYLIVYVINFAHAALIYGYQMWQEDYKRV